MKKIRNQAYKEQSVDFGKESQQRKKKKNSNKNQENKGQQNEGQETPKTTLQPPKYQNNLK